MSINIGSGLSGTTGDFAKFSMSRFASKHMFVVESSYDTVEMPSLYLFRGVFPFNEIQTFPIERDNSNIYYPELVDVNNVELEFYETTDNLVWNYFESWYNSIFAVNSRDDVLFNLPDTFKKDIYAFRLDTMVQEGESNFIRVFGCKYTGCFPIRISDYPLDMSDPGAVTLAISFSVDGAERMQSGSGVNDPIATDRAALRLRDNPVEGRVPTQSREVAIKQSEAQWKALESQLELKQASAKAEIETRRKTVDLGLWVKAILKAAAKTGLNIAEREAYYLARASVHRLGISNRDFSNTVGAATSGRDFLTSL